MKNGNLVWEAIRTVTWPGLCYGFVIGTILTFYFGQAPAIRKLEERAKWYEAQQEATVIQMRQFAADQKRILERLPPQRRSIGAKGEAAGAVEEE